jgi:cell wall-associated NlpC family hydrolase
MPPVYDIRIFGRACAGCAIAAALALVAAASASAAPVGPVHSSIGAVAPAATATPVTPQARARSTSFATDSAREAAAKVWQGAQDVALFALGMIGVDYRFGGETPDRGLDCSGLIRYVFQEVTGTTLPRTSREMSRIGAKVALSDLAPGDLVFFNTRRFAFSHVGLYLGDNRFIHAPSTGGEVEVATLSQAYWRRHFDGARRLVGVLPSLVPTMIDSAMAAPAMAQPPAGFATGSPDGP